jgi:ketosteroid isomerase-like protein
MESVTTRGRPSILTAHAVHAGRYLLAIVLALFSLVVASAPGAGAQAGTPTSADAPTPAECTVAPRSADELRALFREAAATPIPTSPEASPTPAVAPEGVPADEQTVAGITATWREYIACISAGDQARMFALLSDDMVRRQFFIDIAFGVTEDALFDFLAATPEPLSTEQFVPFVPFDDVRVLSDGRVAALGPGEGGRGDVRIFVKEGDRWLVDDWFDLT